MSQPIVYVDTSAIREGRLEQLGASMKELTTYVKANMPRLISYGFFVNESRTQMTVVAVHPDSASLVHHMDVGAAQFRKFADLIELEKIDVYGHISDAVLERLHRKAQMLGKATVAVHEFYAGFAR